MRIGGVAAVVLCLAAMAGACRATGPHSAPVDDRVQAATAAATKTIRFETDEGTWMNLDVSPDGRTVVFDLLGDLYRLPIEGGRAEPLRRGDSWDTLPQFSPDGRHIAFISDADGGLRALWIMRADGSGPRLLSGDNRDIAGFAWSADGRSVTAFRVWGGRMDDNQLAVYHLDGRPPRYLGPETNTPAGISRGRSTDDLYFAAIKQMRLDGSQFPLHIHRYDPTTNRKTLVVDDGFSPRLSPDGQRLAFARRSGGRTSLWIKDLDTGAERKLIEPVTKSLVSGAINFIAAHGALPVHAFTPDGVFIVITIGGKIYRVDAVSGQRHLIPFVARVDKRIVPTRTLDTIIADSVAARQLLWMDTAADGRTVAFSAVGRIWIGDIATGLARPLTDGSDRDYEPVLSPDGQQVAYTTWSDQGPRHLRVVPTRGGPSRVLVSDPSTIVHPRWSPDGSTIAFSRVTTLSCDAVSHDDPSAAAICAERISRGRISRVDIVTTPAAGGDMTVVSGFWMTARSHGALHSSTQFSADSRRLYFSRYMAGNDDDYTEVAVVDRAGGRARPFARLGSDSGVEFAIPSPDGAYIALVGHDALWVYQMDRQADGPAVIERLQTSARLRRVGPHATHASWADADSLVWSFGNRVLRWDAGTGHARVVGRLNATVARAKPPGRIAFTNARIVTMAGDGVLVGGTLVVDGDRIAAVGPAAQVAVPDDAVVVDATGRTIIPGLIDTHAHPHSPASRRWEYYLDQNLNYLANLAWGVTTVLDPQAHRKTDASVQAEMVAAGALIGPRVYSTGAAIAGADVNGGSWAQSKDGLSPQDEQDLRRIIGQRAANGAIMIKSYRVDRRDWRKKIVRLAASQGLGVTTEGGFQARQLTHIADGHTAIEHNLPVAPLYRDVVEYIARSGVFYTPTLPVAYGGLYGDRFFYSRGDTARWPKTRRFWRWPNRRLIDYNTHTPDGEQHFFDAARSARDIVEAGGKVTIGGHGRPDGLGAHWDMWLLQMGGMTPTQVLRAATVTGAEKLGLHNDLGALEVGKLADFLVLTANPLDDIRNTAEIQYVIKNGFVYDADSMTQLYPDYVPLPKPFWHSDEDWDTYRPPPPDPLPDVALTHRRD